VVEAWAATAMADSVLALTAERVAVMVVLSAEVAAVARSVGARMAGAANVAAVKVEVSAD